MIAARFSSPSPYWSAWLAEGLDEETIERTRRNTRTGRPTGSPLFVKQLQTLLGRMLTPHKRGRNPKKKEAKQTKERGKE